MEMIYTAAHFLCSLFLKDLLDRPDKDDYNSLQANLLKEKTMQDSYIQNTDISFLNKKLDNHIQRKIHALYNRKEFQECSLMNMWVADYLFHMELEGKPVFQKDVEAEFFINRATASKMLTLMEKKGLVRRTTSDADSRLKQIKLEPRGLELQKVCCYIREEIEQQLTSCLTEEETETFKKICSKMLEHME